MSSWDGIVARKIGAWFRRAPVVVAEEPPPPDPIASAPPLVLASGQDPVAYARYRLDAHRRHIETWGDGVAERFAGEALTEAYTLIATLRKYDAITPDEERAALALAYRRPEDPA